MTLPVGRSVAVRVPATSANLGPGFDTLGLALAIYDDLTVTVVDEPGIRVDVVGVGAGQVPDDEANLVARAIVSTFAAVGEPVPGLRLSANNVIPHGSGLGSSAAAIVSGIVAVHGLLGQRSPLDLAAMLALATRLEGHPDNVAPALSGGLTIAWTADGVPRSKKLAVCSTVSPLVGVPGHSVSTELARSLQPQTVPYADAVFNVSRSALVIAALTQSPELLFEATEDRLHQDYRAGAMPETHAVMRRLREWGWPAVVSGAGPSILVLAEDPARRAEVVRLIEASTSEPWRWLLPAVDTKGATVNAHQVEAATPS